MKNFGIPSPRGEVFRNSKYAKRYAESLNGRCAIKSDGLCKGKGVVVTDFIEDAFSAIDAKFSLQPEGPILIQERLEGIEVSVHALCNNQNAYLFPISQDHKHLLDNDQGPMTGGMGAYFPAPFVHNGLLQRSMKRSSLVGMMGV
jgi:phosphoribosylamine--glycine ligase